VDRYIWKVGLDPSASVGLGVIFRRLVRLDGFVYLIETDFRIKPVIIGSQKQSNNSFLLIL
jgi:hypothetical protein